MSNQPYEHLADDRAPVAAALGVAATLFVAFCVFAAVLLALLLQVTP